MCGFVEFIGVVGLIELVEFMISLTPKFYTLDPFWDR